MQFIRKISASLCGPLGCALSVWISLAPGASAQISAPANDVAAVASAPLIPQQVRYAGKLSTRAGDTVEAVFRIYATPEGGEPLWTETQKIAVAEDGSYTVLLGAATPTGLPQTVFAGGQARWLGVSIERAPELDRALLASVPYAMKSADAEALSGHTAADFVTQAQLAQLTAQSGQPAAQPEAKSATSGTVTGSGTEGAIPLWTGTLTQGNSVMTQVGSDIGINAATPTATLDVGGSETVSGTLLLPPISTATTASGAQSELMQMAASAWSTTANAPVTQNFDWVVYPTGNNTATPGGSLSFRYNPGGGSAINLISISSAGIVTFSPSQTFPGTIKNVLTTSPLNVASSAGVITVGLNYPSLEATLNALYPRLAVSNSFTGNQSITGGLTITGPLAAASSAVTGLASAAAGFLSNGAVTLKPATTATTSAAVNSPLLELGGSVYSSTSSAAAAQNFAWQTQPSGNDSASPTANLTLLYGAGTAAPAATGLTIAPNGTIHFSPSQVFPITGTGGGTITGITTSSPLTGSGTAGSVALGLNTAALETTLNAVYPQLATGNIFTSYLDAYQTAGPGDAAVLGWGSNGSVGTFGDSDTGYGIQGESASGKGVFGEVATPIAGSQGVLGSTGTVFSTTYSSEAGIANAGVWADNSVTGSGVPVSLFATADDAYGAALITNGADFPTLFVDNNGGTAGEFSAATGYGISASTQSGTGVYGTTSGGGNGVEGLNPSTVQLEAGVLGIANIASATSDEFDIYSGVWGDTGTSSTTVSPAWAIGVLGTADDGHAGVFLNNSAGFSTLFVSNASTGGTGESASIFKTFMASTPDGTCGIGNGGNLSCTGQIKTLVDAGGGTRKVETYAVQSPENWMEDFGSGELKNGVAIVSIDPSFAETITTDANYHVFLTPNGDSKSLYVISKTPTTFEVRESGGGTSSLTFDFRIVAKRRGFETQRLVDVTERFNTEQKAAAITRSSGVRHPHATAKKSPLLASLGSPVRRLAPNRTPTAMRPAARPASTTHP